MLTNVVEVCTISRGCWLDLDLDTKEGEGRVKLPFAHPYRGVGRKNRGAGSHFQNSKCCLW